jgi:hypothetical protein
VNHVNGKDELEARRELYASAAELKRAADAVHDNEVVNAFSIWQDAVLDYLKRTGRGPQDLGSREGKAIAALRAARICLKEGGVTDAAFIVNGTLKELGEL